MERESGTELSVEKNTGHDAKMASQQLLKITLEQISLPLEGRGKGIWVQRKSLVTWFENTRANSLPCLLLCYASTRLTTWLCVSSPSPRSHLRRSPSRPSCNPRGSLITSKQTSLINMRWRSCWEHGVRPGPSARSNSLLTQQPKLISNQSRC